MSRINNNIPSLLAQRVLYNQNMSLNKSLERLSTGLRISRGADDPAGLIASENLRSEKAAINAAVSNAQRAEQVMNVAEGGLQEVSSLLIELQSLVSMTANEAGVSSDEKSANQMQIDSILETIDRIANSTTFQGSKLLNGNYDYTVEGVNKTSLTDVTVNAAMLPENGAARDVTVTTLSAAETAEIYLSTHTGNFTNAGNGEITIEITGMKGTQQFTFASGTAQTDIISAINSFRDQLGVSAVQNTTTNARVEIRSMEYGGDEFVRVKTLNNAGTDIILDAATGGAATADQQDTGLDALVLINGTQAMSDGLTAHVANSGFDVSVTINGSSSMNLANASESFQITGGGADFSLTANADMAGRVSIGIGTVTTGNLGSQSTGYLSDLKSGGEANVRNGDVSNAQNVIDDAIKQVSSLRGRLGAFQKNVIGSSIRSLGVALENTTAAESQIRDTDFAAETATLTRAQILSQAATQALMLSNVQPQQVLSLIA